MNHFLLKIEPVFRLLEIYYKLIAFSSKSYHMHTPDKVNDVTGWHRSFSFRWYLKRVPLATLLYHK